MDTCSNCSEVIGAPELMQLLVQISKVILCRVIMLQTGINAPGAVKEFAYLHWKCVLVLLAVSGFSVGHVPF